MNVLIPGRQMTVRAVMLPLHFRGRRSISFQQLLVEGTDAETHGKEIHPGAHQGIKFEFPTVELHLLEPGNMVQEHELFAEDRSLFREDGTLCAGDTVSLFMFDLQFNPGQIEFLQIQESPLMLRIRNCLRQWQAEGYAERASKDFWGSPVFRIQNQQVAASGESGREAHPGEEAMPEIGHPDTIPGVGDVELDTCQSQRVKIA